MPPEVPAELYDEIISYLWNNNAALKSCSLTCRAMTTPSQKCLFYSVAIRPSLALLNIGHRFIFRDTTSGTSTDFKELLDKSPHIAEYIESVHILDAIHLYHFKRPANSLLIGCSPGSDKIVQGTSTPPKWPDDYRWLHRDSALLLCLPLLRKVKALNIDYEEELSQAGATLIQFLRQPSLHFVRIKSPRCPIVSLDRVIGANVKHLVSRSAYLQDKKSHVSLSDPPMSPVYLDSLVINRPTTLAGRLFDTTG